jgi:hypothetical protein
MEISQKGLLALGFGPHVQVWKDALTVKQNAPYMTHRLPGKTVSVRPRGARRFFPRRAVLLEYSPPSARCRHVLRVSIACPGRSWPSHHRLKPRLH